jgi:DNA helicase-2/ATP-dependent DNA helicase PcrA
VAVLTPRNDRGAQLSEVFRQRGIEYVELLRTTSGTRHTSGALSILLRSLADPTSARRLSKAFEVWRRDTRGDPEEEALTAALVSTIKSCLEVEAYLWPRADHDWLAAETPELPDAHLDLLLGFRQAARRWQRAATLPIDQLILTLASDIFREPSELALAHKLALLLREVAQAHPSYRLTELVEELTVIARNERRFLGFAKEDSDFEPPRGKVTVATMHKAKGLEWDRVYMMSVNNYDFPSGQPHDTYISESWFVRDDLNLEAEALAQLQALANSLPLEPEKSHRPGGEGVVYEGEASRQARLDYVAERLRLLYVCITRARRDLIMTWNTGQRRQAQQATPFIALQSSDVLYKAQAGASEDQPADD